MSIVPKETIEVIAQSIGINSLTPDAALTLAPDVEYRMREIMQEAIKCMRHSRRTTLTTDDVDSALNLRNVEPIYGFATGDPLRFRRAAGHKDLFYIDDKDLEFKDVIEAPLPKAPLDTSLVCHWLAIEGVQPAIPENAPVEGLSQNYYVLRVSTHYPLDRFEHFQGYKVKVKYSIIAAPSDNQKTEQKDEGLPVDIKLPVKHVLSRELQLYFDKITELALTSSESILFKEALVSLASDSGLHPLTPYFTCFIADEVSRGLSDFHLLFALMRLVGSLLQNPHIRIEPYLHQLMPSVVTCLVAKRLGNRLVDNHWELRDFTANLVASICKKFGGVYNNLQTRLTKTLVHTLLDPKRAMTQHYGAIQGLAALGPHVVRLLLLPNIETYMKLLEPEMLLEKQKNEMKRHEAWRVYGALLNASGQCIYDRLKLFPSLPSPPPNVVWKANKGVITERPNNKRKADRDMDQQLPNKKIATDVSTAVATNNSVLPDIEGDERVLVSSSNHNNNNAKASSSSSSRQIPGNNNNNNNNRHHQTPKVQALLNQVWKDDLQSGRLLVTLFELFGESILNFIPNPEVSLFL